MAAPVLSRRVLAAAVTSSLLLGGLVLLGSASAADACPTYTDPAGDAALVADAPAVVNQPSPDGNPVTNSDDDLDLLGVSHSVEAGVFTTTVRVKALGEFGPQAALSDRFTTAFTVSGKAVTIRIDRDYTNLASDGTVGAILTVGGTTSTAAVTLAQDLKASTLVTQVTVADLEKAVGGSLAGEQFSLMSTTAAALYGANRSGVVHTQDTATAPATASYIFGASCSGPAPIPTVTPTSTPVGTPTSPPPTSGPPALLDQPRVGCVAFTDPADDADPTGTGFDSEPSLDVRAVNFRTPADGLQVYVRLNDLSVDRFPLFDQARYVVSLTVGGKAIAVTVDQDGTAIGTVGGGISPVLKPSAKLDLPHSNLVVTLPKAGLAAVLHATPDHGTRVTGTAIATGTGDSTTGRQFDADSAAGSTPEQKTYAYGDNTCFLPPPGVIEIDAPAAGVYSDSTPIVANLVDADDEPIHDALLTVTLSGMAPVTRTTDADGFIELRLPVTAKAGKRTLTVSYAGSSTVSPATATQAFLVKTETAVLKAVAGKGAVTATLTDNDKSPLRSQTVAFTVGKKVTSVKTDAMGHAVLKGLTKGTAVKVAFAAVSGCYTAAGPVTVKAL